MYKNTDDLIDTKEQKTLTTRLIQKNNEKYNVKLLINLSIELTTGTEKYKRKEIKKLSPKFAKLAIEQYKKL